MAAAETESWIEALTGAGVEVVDRRTAQTIAILPGDLSERMIARAKMVAASPATTDALAELFRLVEDGTLVRNTLRDGEPGYAMKAMDLVMALKRTDEALRAAGRLL